MGAQRPRFGERLEFDRYAACAEMRCHIVRRERGYKAEIVAARLRRTAGEPFRLRCRDRPQVDLVAPEPQARPRRAVLRMMRFDPHAEHARIPFHRYRHVRHVEDNVVECLDA